MPNDTLTRRKFLALTAAASPAGFDASTPSPELSRLDLSRLEELARFDHRKAV